MKIKQFLVPLLLIIFGVSLMASESVNVIVKKCIDELGGKKALTALTNFEGSGVGKRGRFEITFTNIKKGKARWLNIETFYRNRVYTTKLVFDGKNAWTESGRGISDQPGLNYVSDYHRELLVLFDKKSKFSLGKSKIKNGAKIQEIIVNRLGRTTSVFINLNNYRIEEIAFKDLYFSRMEVKEMTSNRIVFGDYKRQNGILFAYKVSMYKKDRKETEYNYDNVSFDLKKIKNSMFKRPKRKLDLRYYEEKLS